MTSTHRSPGQRTLQRLTQGLVLGALARVTRTAQPRRLSILIFHRVLPAPDPFLASDPDADQFAAVMAVVRDHFSPLSLAEGLQHLDDSTLPPRAVCVTFDDGYADNLTVALPILKHFEIPLTVFIATGYLDGKCMWNDRVAEAIRQAPGDSIDLRGYGFGVQTLGDVRARARLVSGLLKRLRYHPPDQREQMAQDLAARYAPRLISPMLTRAQVRELRARGVEIGGHTVTHPILADTDNRLAHREIAENKEELEGLLGEPLRFFAYPNGKPDLDCTAVHAKMARDLGYAAAVTTRPGVATAATDRYWLPRFTPWNRTPTPFGIRLLLNLRHMV